MTNDKKPCHCGCGTPVAYPEGLTNEEAHDWYAEAARGLSDEELAALVANMPFALRVQINDHLQVRYFRDMDRWQEEHDALFDQDTWTDTDVARMSELNEWLSNPSAGRTSEVIASADALLARLREEREARTETARHGKPKTKGIAWAFGMGFLALVGIFLPMGIAGLITSAEETDAAERVVGSMTQGDRDEIRAKHPDVSYGEYRAMKRSESKSVGR